MAMVIAPSVGSAKLQLTQDQFNSGKSNTELDPLFDVSRFYDHFFNNVSSAKSGLSDEDLALSGVPGYSFGDYLSGRAAANKEDLFNYYRDKDLQSQAEKFNAEQAALDRAFNASEALKTRDFNANEAKLQRDWETEMSNSAYQRAAADIKALGFNPAVLFSNYGSMASTPSGHAASGSSASSGSGARSSGGHVSSTGANGIGSIIGSAIGAIASLALGGIRASSALQIAKFTRY